MYRINYFNHAILLLFLSSITFFNWPGNLKGQKNVKKPIIKYGIASYYAHKFNGRKTSTGALYDSKKMSAACNVLPLRTWVKVTNLKNKKFIVVQINDRLHFRNKRLIDLSKAAARQLDYIKSGLTRVKVEVIRKATKHIKEI